MKPFILASAVVVATMPTAVSSKEKPPVFVEAKVVKDAPVVTLDPAKAYVLIRTPGAIPLAFSKVPTDENRMAYERVKAAAFEEARADYVKKLARYKSDQALIVKNPQLRVPVPVAPIEPTTENFRFTPFEQLANFAVGPFNRFSNKEGSVYLHAVTPGTYRILGQMDPILGGGHCYCMGSVMFEAVAGKITDLGTLDADPAAAPPPKGDSSAPRVYAYALALTPASDATPVDARLTALPRTNAVYRPAGKMANYWGIGVTRLPAIAGVLGYDRDRIIDVAAQKSGSATAAP